MHGLFFRRLRLFPAVLALGVSALALLPAPARAAKAKMLDLTDTVFANRITTKFALLLRNSDLASFYSSRGPFTLFLPTDSAFSKIPPDEFQALLQPANSAVLQRIVLYHLVNGNRFSAKDLLKQKSLVSCEGTPLAIHASRTGAQFVQKSKILRADMHCANGVIHEIDTVLLPPGLVLPTPGAPPAPGPSDSSSTNAPADATNAPPAGDTTSIPATNVPAAREETNAPAAETNSAPAPATNAPLGK
jgi:uncharacterized surface protein with fasciclin (FAS1) repeats